MTRRQDFELFLQKNQIHYTIPADILANDSFCASMHQACESLVTNTPSVLNQYTFDTLCRITTANLESGDLLSVAKCFVSMGGANLLTTENIQALVKRVINAPPRVQTGILGSCAQKLTRLLDSCPWLTQDNFTFIMQSNLDVDKLALYMTQLHIIALDSPANCQALLDSGLTVLDLSMGSLNVGTPEEFNQYILEACDKKLSGLDVELTINDLAEDNTVLATIYSHASSLFSILLDMRKSDETQKDPRHFLRLIVSIHKVLPTKDNQPTKADIDELIALANVSEGHPSPLWKSAGKTLMILGSVIAMAVGIVLTLGTIGSAISIAGASGLSALTGVGFFAYGNTRTGLSKNIMDLAEEVQQQPSLLSQ